MYEPTLTTRIMLSILRFTAIFSLMASANRTLVIDQLVGGRSDTKPYYTHPLRYNDAYVGALWTRSTDDVIPPRRQ